MHGCDLMIITKMVAEYFWFVHMLESGRKLRDETGDSSKEELKNAIMQKEEA